MRTISTVLMAALMAAVFAQPVVSQTETEEKRISQSIPGYSYGDDELARSPLTIEDLSNLKKTLLWSEEDDRALKMAAELLEGQVDDILDTWYGFVGANDHLVYYFSNAQGKPDADYLAAVRKRFGQWILDVCRRPHDQNWLDWQHEIALRHHRSKKNETDNADAVDHIQLRYMTAFIYPITATMRSFLEEGDHSADEVEAMYQAWFKSVVLHVTVWSQPYVKQGDF